MTITPEVQLTYYTFRFLNLPLRVNSPNEQLSFSVFISSSRCVVFVLTDEQWCGVCLPSAHHLLLSVSSGSSPPLIIFALTAIFLTSCIFLLLVQQLITSCCTFSSRPRSVISHQPLGLCQPSSSSPPLHFTSTLWQLIFITPSHLCVCLSQLSVIKSLSRWEYITMWLQTNSWNAADVHIEAQSCRESFKKYRNVKCFHQLQSDTGTSIQPHRNDVYCGGEMLWRTRLKSQTCWCWRRFPAVSLNVFF